MAESHRSACGHRPHDEPAKSRCAVRGSFSPPPVPLPWGEGEPFSLRRAIQICRLSTARCALFPLPEGEDQGEGKRREVRSRASDHSRKCRTGRVLRRRRRFPKSGPKRNLMSLLVASFLGTNLASAESEPKNPLPAVNIYLRTNSYGYATNDIDLVTGTNSLGVQVSSNYFNSYHQVRTNFDALNELT